MRDYYRQVPDISGYRLTFPLFLVVRTLPMAHIYDIYLSRKPFVENPIRPFFDSEHGVIGRTPLYLLRSPPVKRIFKRFDLFNSRTSHLWLQGIQELPNNVPDYNLLLYGFTLPCIFRWVLRFPGSSTFFIHRLSLFTFSKYRRVSSAESILLFPVRSSSSISKDRARNGSSSCSATTSFRRSLRLTRSIHPNTTSATPIATPSRQPYSETALFLAQAHEIVVLALTRFLCKPQ